MKHQSTLNNLWFTDPIAILLAIAAGSGVLIDGLWRKRPLGFTLAGILLPFFVLLVSATLSMGRLQARDGNPDDRDIRYIIGSSHRDDCLVSKKLALKAGYGIWGGFFSVAAFSVAPLFTTGRLERWIAGAFLIYGVLGTISVLGYATGSPIVIVGFIAWGPVLGIAVLLLGIRFWRDFRTIQTGTQLVTLGKRQPN